MTDTPAPVAPSKSAQDYFPKTSSGSWPAALASALKSGDEPHAKVFEAWKGPAGFDASGLANPPLTPIATKIPVAVASTGTPNCILEIRECENVRALGSRPTPIALSPWLTVFYGRNGSGKSSLAGAVSVLGGALDIGGLPGLANEDPTRDRFTGLRGASFKVCALAAVRSQPISFAGGTDVQWRSDGNIAVAVAMRLLDKKSVDDFGAQLRLDVPPQLGLEVFDHASATLQAFEGTLKTLRNAASKRSDALVPEDERTQAEAALPVLDTVSHEDAAVLEKERVALQEEADRLAKSDVAAAAARTRVTALENERNYLVSLAKPDRDEATIRAALKEREELQKAAHTGLGGLLKDRPLAITDTQAWQRFVAAGEAVLVAEGTQEYPKALDACIYCGQELGQAALAFLKAVRDEVHGARSAKISELSSQIQAASDAVRYLAVRLGVAAEKLDTPDWPACIPSADSRAQLLADVNNELVVERKTLAAVATAESLATARTENTAKLATAQTACFAKTNHARLTEYKHLRTLERSIGTALTEIEAQKRAWSTQKTLAMNALGLESFRKRFELECERLQLRVPVQLKVASPSGISERRYSVRGKEPRKTLSESEVATWALADTLSELAHRGGGELLLIDDPVSSMDTERITLLADRILDEAANRQIVVFTHNRHFFHALVHQSKSHAVFKGASGRGPAWYIVESFQGKTGVVSEYVNRESAPALLKRVEDMIGAGPLDEDQVDLCFLLVRRAIEVIVDQVILRGVRTLFDPEATETKWKELKDIKQVPASLIDSLHDLHKGISRLGGLHNTGSFHLFCPISDDVRYYHGEASRLLGEIEAL